MDDNTSMPWSARIQRSFSTVAFIFPCIASLPGCGERLFAEADEFDGSGAWSDEGGGSSVTEDHLDVLAGCGADLSRAQLRERLEISYGFQTSMHELIVCGGITQDFCNGIIFALLESFENNLLQPPAGMVWEGKGVYTTQAADGVATMDLRARWPFDTGEFRAGDPIAHDLFDKENYFINSWSEVDSDTQEITVYFDEPGPLAPLLGVSPDATSPIHWTWNDILEASEVVYQIRLDGKVTVFDDRSTVEVAYTANMTEATVGELANDLEYLVDDASAWAPGQGLEVSRWELTFERYGMLGAVDFEVRGEDLDYDATLVYDHDAYGTLDFVCAPWRAP